MMESTTVNVSKDAVKKLAVLQRRLGKRSLDETVQTLVTRHRRVLIDEAFGGDGASLRAFRERDCGEDCSNAFARIELFAGTLKGRFAKSKMEEAGCRHHADAILAEVARIFLREGMKEETTRPRLATILDA